MILCDTDLITLMYGGLIQSSDQGMDLTMVNPASVDIRVGRNMIIEKGFGRFTKLPIPEEGYLIAPGQFVLMETWETFCVPNGYAMDLRLKSSTARRGFDHSLAFWVDPGWKGVLTMEVKNVLQYNSLRIKPGDRFAQVVVHRLSGLSQKPYAGRYNGAAAVEPAKD